MNHNEPTCKCCHTTYGVGDNDFCKLCTPTYEQKMNFVKLLWQISNRVDLLSNDDINRLLTALNQNI